MAVLDYISGMTDIYALDIYQKINGISLPIEIPIGWINWEVKLEHLHNPVFKHRC